MSARTIPYCTACFHHHRSHEECELCLAEMRIIAPLFVSDLEQDWGPLMRRQECGKLWTKTGADDGMGYVARTREQLKQALIEWEFVTL